MNKVTLEAIQDGLHSLSIDGKEYVVNKENQIKVESEHVYEAIIHGFKVAEEKILEEVKQVLELTEDLKKEDKIVKKGKK